MPNRLGVVAWWLGALVLAVTLAYVAAGQWRRMDCSETLTLKGQLDAARQARTDQSMTQSAVGGQSYVIGQQDRETLGAVHDPRETPQFLAALVFCQRESQWPLQLGAGVVAALVLWAIAFFAGGSFFRPPRRGRQGG